jgi:5-methylcytosine-specific restriction endonuclease McrA
VYFSTAVFSAIPEDKMAKQRRASLSEEDRKLIREKTNGHCHICGGQLGEKWDADHVVPHGLGGTGTFDNYLPACMDCNGLRWFYDPEQFKKILQLGVYADAEIRHKTSLGAELSLLVQRRTAQNAKRRTERKTALSGK